MASWKQILRNSITSYEQLRAAFPGLIEPAVAEVIKRYPLRINSYYLELIKHHGQPLFRQAVPSPAELACGPCEIDPLAEDRLSPVPGIVHKYPDRVLFLVANQCALYCRFCTRKRHVGRPSMPDGRTHLDRGLDYLRRHPEIKEVLVSGGDPLLLEDHLLEDLLRALRSIDTLEIIRIGSRVPCTLPMRITTRLCRILKRYHPLFINTHFNHPAELTEEAKQACTRLADAGIPLGSQTVLLRGVNDSPETIRTLMQGLLRFRVKPYYLFQTDITAGTDHFRTTTAEGLAIMEQLLGHISGMAVPAYALDAPGGRGKIRLSPNYVLATGSSLSFRSYQGDLCSYPEPDTLPPAFSQ
ncbi:KamA family radical SAM protein [Desulfofustis limnaeus]|jgi:lysine 2,3-aminomutase|uniref:Lysine 2,3-aminomutase n=1 Tax=Desulfofustis limnaeus TaxID=2740163 RepID=A0ABM7W802_9BACT|nr:KamA family radical SAM protein [Desulfofustis limnaeus]MDX9894480.1 KamA family radical SAM protein [Desulfofustis sp.]BDD87112.1 lysine 2,3-aminomutase [Desulfofustis limnaeus]